MGVASQLASELLLGRVGVGCSISRLIGFIFRFLHGETPERNAQRMRVSARSSAEGESYADRIAGVARGSNSSQSLVTKLDGAQT